MTIQDVRAEPTTASRQWRLVAVAVAVLTAVAAGIGFVSGTAWTHHRTELGGWHTAVAQTGAKQISIEYDGWTYGVSDSVSSWIDHNGSVHDSGWPQCLRPPGRQVTVRFQARVVTIDGMTTRPIVSIDCRTAE